MKQNTILITVVALLIGGITGYLIADGDTHYTEEMPHSDMMTGDADAYRMPMGNMGAMDHSAMMVSSEKEFVEGMIPHHQEAVDTANEVLARGGSSEAMRTLATEIVAAQEGEIAMLKEWHMSWYGESYEVGGSYQPMMRDLSQLSGADLDRRFLEDMIPHHMGAIMMAQSVRPHIEHQEITDMANAIMETQTAEIALMRTLLAQL
jgi:uncharacterized protein (DUF305 family)